MRCAGFDKINLAVAGELGMQVARVPAYSPEAVAQHAISLLLTLKWNLATPPVAGATPGIDFANTTVGVLGTGRIGYLFAKVVQGQAINLKFYIEYDVEF